MRFLFPAYISLILFVALLALGLGRAPVFGDADTAWHLAAGDHILAEHVIPLYDSWSFTAAGETWYNLSWLFDIGISKLVEVTGFSGLYLLTLFIFAGSIAGMAHYSLKRGANPLAVFLLCIPVLLIIYGGTIARPNMCSVAMAIMFYWLLHRYRETSRLKDMFLLPVLMTLWVNLHGGFLLAFILIGIFLAEAILHNNRNRMRDYGFIIAACMATTLINPYGFAVYYGAYKTISGTFDKSFITEWAPVRVGYDIAMTAMLALVICIGNATDKRIALVDRMLAVFVLFLALSSARHSAIAALLMMPYLSLRLSYVLDESRIAQRFRTIDNAIRTDLQKNDVKIMGMGMVLLATSLLALPYPRYALLSEPVGFSKKLFPIAEAAYVAEHYPHLHFFNDYNLGGYLDYLWHGKVKVFVDGRASSLYSSALLQDYTDFTESKGFGGRAEVIAAYYHIDGLILPHTDNIRLPWNPYWKLAYHGEVADVFLRNDLAEKLSDTSKP